MKTFMDGICFCTVHVYTINSKRCKENSVSRYFNDFRLIYCIACVVYYGYV